AVGPKRLDDLEIEIRDQLSAQAIDSRARAGVLTKEEYGPIGYRAIGADELDLRPELNERIDAARMAVEGTDELVIQPSRDFDVSGNYDVRLGDNLHVRLTERTDVEGNSRWFDKDERDKAWAMADDPEKWEAENSLGSTKEEAFKTLEDDFEVEERFYRPPGETPGIGAEVLGMTTMKEETPLWTPVKGHTNIIQSPLTRSLYNNISPAGARLPDTMVRHNYLKPTDYNGKSPLTNVSHGTLEDEIEVAVKTAFRTMTDMSEA
ncbi:unnamed protein product, partial [marine sediment metagenome]